MNYFDSHCHIGLIHEDPIEQLLIIQDAKMANVSQIISICNNINDFTELYNNLATATNVYYGIGVSPSEVERLSFDWEHKLESCVKLPRVVAIGETGLDYYRKFGSKNAQIELFIRHLELAEKHRLPVIVHNREAGEDVLEIVKQKTPSKGIVFHCYSENWDYAKRALDLNCYFSFAGNLTYRNAVNLHETAKNLPADRILVESEAPFMVPAIYRGKRNKPAYLSETVKKLAEMRKTDLEEMAAILYSNSLRFFGLQDLQPGNA